MSIGSETIPTSTDAFANSIPQTGEQPGGFEPSVSPTDGVLIITAHIKDLSKSTADRTVLTTAQGDIELPPGMMVNALVGEYGGTPGATEHDANAHDINRTYVNEEGGLSFMPQPKPGGASLPPVVAERVEGVTKKQAIVGQREWGSECGTADNTGHTVIDLPASAIIGGTTSEPVSATRQDSGVAALQGWPVRAALTAAPIAATKVAPEVKASADTVTIAAESVDTRVPKHAARHAVAEEPVTVQRNVAQPKNDGVRPQDPPPHLATFAAYKYHLARRTQTEMPFTQAHQYALAEILAKDGLDEATSARPAEQPTPASHRAWQETATAHGSATANQEPVQPAPEYARQTPETSRRASRRESSITRRVLDMAILAGGALLERVVSTGSHGRHSITSEQTRTAAHRRTSHSHAAPTAPASRHGGRNDQTPTSAGHSPRHGRPQDQNNELIDA